MARLEFLFIRALDRTEHGLTKSRRQLAESPQLFVQILPLAFKRSDDGEDPPEWRIQNEERRQALALAAYSLLDLVTVLLKERLDAVSTSFLHCAQRRG